MGVGAVDWAESVAGQPSQRLKARVKPRDNNRVTLGTTIAVVGKDQKLFCMRYFLLFTRVYSYLLTQIRRNTAFINRIEPLKRKFICVLPYPC
jgi:hypothetical protein